MEKKMAKMINFILCIFCHNLKSGGKKQDPITCCLQESSPKYIVTNRLKAKRGR